MITFLKSRQHRRKFYIFDFFITLQERIDTGGTVILTLKDKGVLDEEDDTLVNVNMIDDEKFEKVTYRLKKI